MNSRFLQIFLVISILIITNHAEGQSSREAAGAVKIKYFQIPGRVKLEKGDPSGAVVNLINLDSKQIEKSITIPSSGKFDLKLSFYKEYKISIIKDGYYDKEIDVSTVIPTNIWEKDSIFPPFYIVVTLYKRVEGAKLSFEGKTNGKVTYSPNGTLDNFDANVFIYDQAIQDEIKDALKNTEDHEFNKIIAEALEYEKKNDLSTAFTLYSEALKIKSSDKFVKDKLKELASDLKNLGNEVKIQAEFNRLIALGDANINSLKYSDAIQYYKGALKVLPNNPVALSKLADAEKQLALAGDKIKKDAEFNRLIAAGDGNVSQSKYAEAITSFKQALDIRPGDSIALARIADAEKQLALVGDKAKRDVEFNRLIAAGDASKITKNYEDALISYKSALKIKSNEVVNAKIAETEQLMLRSEADRVRLDAERQAIALKQQKYKEAVDRADLLFASKSYTEAKPLYLQSLLIDPTATYPGVRIREIEKIMAQLQANATVNEQESAKVKLYNDAMNRGANYFTAKQYSEAISAYREAQKIEPSQIPPSEKIKEIQLIIDALSAKTLDDQKSASDQKLNSDEKLYLEKIKIADENFKKSQWSVARFYYIEALKIKQSDSYSLAKMDACDKMIDSGITAEKMQEYRNKIEKADDEMKAKNYSAARFYYRSASDIMKWETYPLQQLKDIDKIVAEKLTESDQRLFKENLDKADDAFIRKEYPVARFYYNKAIELSLNDHVSSRLKEIESIVNGSESKKINIAYDDFIKKGDEAVKQQNSAIARFYFQKATALKPNENYPKEELMKIN